ncbi:sigma-70 family RNA polymerase sigma factor [Paraflavisolibacter sp. H34]|uniref:sigma-70 family RNA polymerase sigma factor n=1 Tax=Huijunlia imazamoxiresistens TaxID=3127457 RepID=UPI00301652A4
MNAFDTPQTETLPDNEIIHRVLRGEKEWYALIVRRYNQRLYRIALSITKAEAEAEEAMQVAYIHAYEHLDHFAFRSAFATWLTRILINECLLQVKKRQQFTAMPDAPLSPHDHSPTPLTEVLRSELNQMLEQAILALPEKYRTVFVLREVEGLNVAETAASLDLSAVNIKVRLNRAKALLRQSLGQLYRKEELLPFHLSRCNRLTDQVMLRISRIK